MPKEDHAGPLWEREPKTKGFQFLVPNPNELLEWARKKISETGDLTRGEMYARGEEQLKKLMLGESRKLVDHERNWMLSINDSLFEKIRIEFMAAYSPDSGEWSSIGFYLDFSSQAIEEEKHYQLPQLAAQIAQKLKEKGFTQTSTEGNFMDNQAVVVSDKDGKYPVNFSLGYKNLDAAIQEDPKQDMEEAKGLAETGVMAYFNDLPLSLMGFMKALQHFQSVTPYFVDACYEVMGFESPDNLLALSQEQELL